MAVKSLKIINMVYTGIFAALLVALLFTLVFSASYRKRGSWGALLIFFLIIFLASWAGQLWINPIGPMVYGVSWVPLIFVGLVFAFLLMAASPPQPPKRKGTTGGIGASGISASNAPADSESTEEEEVAALAVGVFFWILLIVLFVAIVLGYYRVSTNTLAV
jgi:hypothetical protein